MEADSRGKRRPIHLVDSEYMEHEIEFMDGRPVAVICTKLGRRKIMAMVSKRQVRLVNSPR